MFKNALKCSFAINLIKNALKCLAMDVGFSLTEIYCNYVCIPRSKLLLGRSHRIRTIYPEGQLRMNERLKFHDISYLSHAFVFSEAKSVFWIFLKACDIKKYFITLSFTLSKRTSRKLRISFTSSVFNYFALLSRKTFRALRTKKRHYYC